MKPYTPELDTTVKIFAYGDPGTGKTTLCASSLDDPRTSPVLWFNAAGNPHSIRRRPIQPTIITLEQPGDLDIPYDYLAAGQPRTGKAHPFVKWFNDNGVALPEQPFKTVILDTVTEYQRLCLDKILANDQKGLGQSLNVPEFKHWGQVLAQLTKMARYLYALPMSVIITAQERPDKDEQTGAFQYSPGLYGQARSEVPGYSLLTVRLVRRSKFLSAQKGAKGDDNEPAYSVGYIDQVGKFLAKDQYNSLPPVIPEITIPKILDCIYGHKST